MKTYINIFVSSLFAVFFAYALVISPALALEVSDNDDTAAPSTRDNGDTSSPNIQDNGDTSIPNTQDNGTTADLDAPNIRDNGDTSSPNTNDNGDTSSPNTNDNGDTSGNPEVIIPDGNNDSSGSRSGGGSRRNRNAVVENTNNNVALTDDCSYLTTYMRLGGNNNMFEVVKLQTFLKNSEGLDVDLNGIFDQKTFEAVKAFQDKYLAEIMIPWGANTPSGQVYFTTQKKINELVCKTSFELSASQLTEIESYKTNLENNSSSEEIIDDSVEVGSGDIESNSNSQTASAFETSILGKIWKFIKWLFGY